MESFVHYAVLYLTETKKTEKHLCSLAINKYLTQVYTSLKLIHSIFFFSMDGIYFVRKWKPDGSKDTSEIR